MGLISRVSSRTYRKHAGTVKETGRIMSTEVMTLRGTLEHHKGWITQVACSPVHPDMLISASRDKTLLVWQLTGKDSNKNVPYGVPLRALKGHSHFVSDVVISSCGAFAVSGSWDKTLRLWDIERGITSTVFKGHKHDVMSVAFSADNRQIISSSRDKTIRLWNTLGECKWVQESSTSGNKSHTEWVSTVQFSPTTNNPVIVSGGWDAKVKVWHLSNFHLKSNFDGHNTCVNSVTVSPDGSLAASGGKDVPPSSGISVRPPPTPFTVLMPSRRSPSSSSAPTDTGFAPPPAALSKYGTWNSSSSSKSSRSKSVRTASHPSARACAGLRTA